MKTRFSHFTAFIFCLCFLTPFNNLLAQIKTDLIEIPLIRDSEIIIEGSHRYMKIAGITGLHVTSLKTKAFIETTAFKSDKGTVSFWMSPLENIDKAPDVGSSMIYPFLSDVFPPSIVDSSSFSIYYQGTHYPRVIARFTDGSFWGQMDFGIAPFVYAEALPLQKGQWYNIAVTWDKTAETLKMYINGELAGHNFSAKAFKQVKNKIYIGNPLMVISHFKIQSDLLTMVEIKKEYRSIRPASNKPSDNTLRAIMIPQDKPALDFQLDKSWHKVYECNFTNKSDLDAWIFQTGDIYKDKFKLEITGTGLVWETPNIIHKESRGYLWCPVTVEGDQCIEFEFQLLSPKGLALLIMCASGLQGEDIIENHGLRKTGSMSDMNSNYRNYHWEFVRRVEAMRTDVETQYVNKNPWGKTLYVGCIPRIEQNRWIKIRFTKIDNKLVGSLDGKTVFNVEENPYDNNGPGFNSGRVVLRQMYNTSMSYRNFVIYQKKIN